MVELILENEQDKEELTPEIEKAIKDVCVAVMEEDVTSTLKSVLRLWIMIQFVL